MTELIDLVVDERILLDIHILAGDIGLGLVIIVIGHEIFDRRIGEEGPHLRADLCGQRFVRLKDEGGSVDLGNDVGHGEGLARAGHAEKRLSALSGTKALDQRTDGLRLVARGAELAFQHKAVVVFLRHSVHSLPFADFFAQMATLLL